MVLFQKSPGITFLQCKKLFAITLNQEVTVKLKYSDVFQKSVDVVGNN